MFPAWHIALTALVTAVITAAVTAAATTGWRRRIAGHASLALGDLIGVGVAAGLGVLLWRLGANVPTLNDDPIPGVSPADVLSGPLAYVAAGVYVRLRGAGASERLAVAPAVAALVAVIVNIVTI
jgi:hypothetical protein